MGKVRPHSIFVCTIRALSLNPAKLGISLGRGLCSLSALSDSSYMENNHAHCQRVS